MVVAGAFNCIMVNKHMSAGLKIITNISFFEICSLTLGGCSCCIAALKMSDMWPDQVV